VLFNDVDVTRQKHLNAETKENESLASLHDENTFEVDLLTPI
jgi:hypothetical protein